MKKKSINAWAYSSTGELDGVLLGHIYHTKQYAAGETRAMGGKPIPVTITLRKGKK